MEKIEKIDKIEKINKKYINDLLDELAKSRPIFHNEQDFQFELAQKIREHIDNEDIIVRLEYFIGLNKNGKNRIYIDIMIIEKNSEGKNKAIAIELKYKTKSSDGHYYENEYYDLKDQGADDWGCYYIHKDLKRIENLVYPNKEENEEEYNLNNIVVEKGYVIFLTNDSKSYKKKRTGIFKNYALIDEDNEKRVTKKGEIFYCHKEYPYEKYDYNDILNEHAPNGEFSNYSSVKDKKPIVFTKIHKGEWCRYSKLEGKTNTIDDMHDVLEKLIFEVKK